MGFWDKAWRVGLMGLSVGAAFTPWGMVGGAVAGAVTGFIAGGVNQNGNGWDWSNAFASAGLGAATGAIPGGAAAGLLMRGGASAARTMRAGRTVAALSSGSVPVWFSADPGKQPPPKPPRPLGLPIIELGDGITNPNGLVPSPIIGNANRRPGVTV